MDSKATRAPWSAQDNAFLRAYGITEIPDAEYQERMLDQDRYALPCEEIAPWKLILLRAFVWIGASALGVAFVVKLILWIGAIL